MKPKTIKHVDRDDYVADNRDDRETELQFETEDTRFIVRVDPWLLLDDLIANMCTVAALYEIRKWRDTINEVHDELDARIEACIEEDMNDQAS